MAKRPLPLAEVYRLIEPGPVVLVSTMSGGRANIMTMSWHMMVDFEPPIIACVMSNRDYSFEALKKTRECVINVPTVELAFAGDSRNAKSSGRRNGTVHLKA